jgi:formylglycine-generating enzyme required for sulfatase activity
MHPEMISIGAGTFWMGSEAGQDNEKPIHAVWLGSFQLAKFPVINAEYRIYVAGSGAPEPAFWRESQFAAPEKPVVGVNWFEARSYCEWLSEKTGQPFRLPTEAEWEKGARGGLEKQNYPWGQLAPGEMLLPGCDTLLGGPARIGCGDINNYGLCDMSGGVHEWCSDFYDAGYYEIAPPQNPQGPASGKRRASRGGSWRHAVKFSRCAARSSLNPNFHYSDYGFRVALDGGQTVLSYDRS